MKINYGLSVIDLETGELLHFVGYENMPTELDIEELEKELQTDEEFGLMGIDDYVIIESTDEELNFFKSMLEDEGAEI